MVDSRLLTKGSDNLPAHEICPSFQVQASLLEILCLQGYDFGHQTVKHGKLLVLIVVDRYIKYMRSVQCCVLEILWLAFQSMTHKDTKTIVFFATDELSKGSKPFLSHLTLTISYLRYSNPPPLLLLKYQKLHLEVSITVQHLHHSGKFTFTKYVSHTDKGLVPSSCYGSIQSLRSQIIGLGGRGNQ